MGAHTFAVTPPPPDKFGATTTSRSITLSWTQPYMEEFVQGYEIAYTYSVRGCSEVSPQVTVLINGSSVRSHTLLSSPQTPVEEDSVYNIFLAAINTAGIQSSKVLATAMTSQAGT